MVVSDVIFEAKMFEDELIFSFYYRGKGFNFGFESCDNRYAEQGRRGNSSGEGVCQTSPKEDQRKKHARVIPMVSSRDFNYVKDSSFIPLAFSRKLDFVESCDVIFVMGCGS